jgi:hypothetical protein
MDILNGYSGSTLSNSIFKLVQDMGILRSPILSKYRWNLLETIVSSDISGIITIGTR